MATAIDPAKSRAVHVVDGTVPRWVTWGFAAEPPLLNPYVCVNGHLPAALTNAPAPDPTESPTARRIAAKR